jgi:DNA replication initiation complex subunit (GINS family)
VVFLIRHAGPVKLIDSISKSITQQLSTSTLESLLTEIFLQIQKIHDSLSELQDDYIQLQDVRSLKKEVETVLGIDR